MLTDSKKKGELRNKLVFRSCVYGGSLATVVGSTVGIIGSVLGINGVKIGGFTLVYASLPIMLVAGLPTYPYSIKISGRVLTTFLAYFPLLKLLVSYNLRHLSYGIFYMLHWLLFYAAWRRGLHRRLALGCTVRLQP